MMPSPPMPSLGESEMAVSSLGVHINGSLAPLEPSHAAQKNSTIPGIGAGCLLVFILAIGYYITPALVGGASGSLISNTIAYHMKSSLDWAFASALGTMLLVGVLTIYWIYNKLVGIDNIKLG